MSRLGASGISTNPSVPLKLNPCPTLPLANVAPPRSVPVLPWIRSLPLPSAGHQPTRPEGAGRHTVGAGFTMTFTCAGATDPTVAVIVAVPGATDVTTPVGLTVATVASDDENVTPEATGAVLASEYVPVTVRD